MTGERQHYQVTFALPALTAVAYTLPTIARTDRWEIYLAALLLGAGLAIPPRPPEDAFVADEEAGEVLTLAR